MSACLALLILLLLTLSAAATSAALVPRSGSRSPLWPFKDAVQYRHITLDQAARPPQVDTDCIVLVVGTDRPHRRALEQPLLSFSAEAATLVPHAVQRLLAEGMQQLQQLGAGGVFSLELGVMPAELHNQGGSGPLVVFDASSGRVLLGPAALQGLQSTPLHVVAAAVQATTAAAQQLASLAGGEAAPGGLLSQLLPFAPKAAVAGVAAAFVSSVPRWFCFVCPIVMGLLAPLVINAGVGEAADLACKALQLSDDECVDLWFAALGLGMVLSLLSAIPIYKVCRLYECAHPNSTTSVATS